MKTVGYLQTTFIAILAVLGSVLLIHAKVPPEHVPWRPLAIEDPIGVATRLKIADLKGDPAACFAVLDAAGIAYARKPDTPPGDPCAFEDALVLERSLVPYGARLEMTCPLTVALAVWERQSLLPYAREIMGAELSRVDSYGSYACRRRYGRSSGRYSEHATANAVDISGFRFDDGQRISVRADYDANTAAGQYLAAVRADACDLFAAVLGPEYDEAHADHFHLDLGRATICR